MKRNPSTIGAPQLASDPDRATANAAPASAAADGAKAPERRPPPAGHGHPHGMAAPAERPIEAFFAEVGDDPLTCAFRGRQAVHPFVGLQPVPEDEVEGTWATLCASPRCTTSVAYVHVPFCLSHCLFCGFYQNAWRPEHGPLYVDSLITQMRRGRASPMQAEGPIRALYFGGGTPTLLSGPDLARLIDAARTYLPLAPDCEITVEGQVHAFGLDKARAAFDAGANRLSLGVQTFDDHVRRSMGRHCSGREVVATLEGLLRADQAAIVIDLIFGLPGQDATIWQQDLRQAVALGLDGVDLYALKAVRNAPLARTVDNGRMPPPATQPLGDFYGVGSEYMRNARWDPVSCTHWRGTTRERNLYNLLIKSGADCVAVGAGAGGSVSGADAGFSYRNLPSVEDYRERVDRGDPVVAGLMRQSPHRRLFDAIKGELERGRLNTTHAAMRLGSDGGPDWQGLVEPLLAQWQQAGLVTRDGDWMELTLAGRFWQVQLTLNLLQWLNQCLAKHQT